MLLASMALAACAAGRDKDARQQTVWVEDGEPVNCIPRSQVRSIRVINDRTIDFEMTGRRAYRNALPFRCFDLTVASETRFNSLNRLMRFDRPSTGFLCRADRFAPWQPGRRPRSVGMGSCQLGAFQPLARAPVSAAPRRDAEETRP